LIDTTVVSCYSFQKKWLPDLFNHEEAKMKKIFAVAVVLMVSLSMAGIGCKKKEEPKRAPAKQQQKATTSKKKATTTTTTRKKTTTTKKPAPKTPVGDSTL
jgi:hypothetical protein